MEECKCGGFCNNKMDEKTSKKIEKLFDIGDVKDAIVVISFGHNFERHFIGKIYNMYDHGILLYDVFEMITKDNTNHFIGCALGTVSTAISIPHPLLCGIPDIDVVEAYERAVKSRREIFEDMENEKLLSNVKGNMTIQ